MLLAASAAAAQRDTLLSSGYALEIETQSRWLHARQQPSFTPYRSEHRWIVIDTLPPPADGRTLSLLYQAFSGLNATARLRLSRAGRVLATRIDWPESSRSPYESVTDSIRLARHMLFANGTPDGQLSLPEERLWGMVPTFPVDAPRAGARWTDTLRMSDQRGDFRQSLSGVRMSTIVRDTTVDGRRLWIVRDSAWVRYRERWSDRERTLDTLATVTRDVQGVLRGRHLYDPRTGLFRLRTDTAHFAGEATLGYADGRTFRTPARYDRVRRWVLHDSASYAARRAEIRRSRDASYGGMVMLPRNELQRRLSEGDRALQDSIVAAWRGESDPNRREELFLLLEFWGNHSSEARAAFLEARLAAGDTAGALRELATRRLYTGQGGVDAETVRRVLPFMEDPGLAFAFGLDRDPFYENLRQGLLYRPPAITPDTASWACTPEACRLLARQWETAREPRLRDVGLIARLVLDPARWSDTVLARADSAFLRPAVQVIRGVGATWPAASDAPLPPPGAGWRAWQEWANGDTASRGVRFERSHVIGLLFYAKRTGRDVVGELRRDFESAASDSARLVFGTILLGLEEHRPDPARVAERIRNGSAADFSLGAREMLSLFGTTSAPDPETRARLTDELLRAVLAGEDPWPLASPFARPYDFEPVLHSNAERPVFLVADSLPPEVRERWKDRVRLISSADLRLRPDREPGVYFAPPVIERAGPFARVGIRYGERQARAPDEAPVGYAGGLTAYLVETPDGWALVAVGRWVT